MTCSSSSTAVEPSKLIWVRVVSGRLRVRWARILAFLSATVVINFLGTAIVSRFTQMPIKTELLFAPLCVIAAYIVVIVDLQRQRLLHGNWRFRFSLQTIFLLTASASAFFALLTHAVRENQRLFAENQTIKEQLESLMQGGTAWIGTPGGSGITCQMTRPSFSDDDLASLIGLASRGGERPCELSTLFLGSTSVTSSGVCRLGTCEKLVFLELPPMDLSEAAIDALAKCRRLEFLVIDERRLSAKQLNRLRTALPEVRINGRAWTERNRVK